MSFHRLTTVLPVAAIVLSSATFSTHRSSACDTLRCTIRASILRIAARLRSSSARAAAASATFSTHLSSACDT
ncbi:MAG: hypothetical protein ACK56I_37655, partial [bacterium]